LLVSLLVQSIVGFGQVGGAEAVYSLPNIVAGTVNIPDKWVALNQAGLCLISLLVQSIVSKWVEL
jgi:hypothetical protein